MGGKTPDTPDMPEWKDYKKDSSEIADQQVEVVDKLADYARSSGLDPAKIAEDPDGFFQNVLMGDAVPQMQEGAGQTVDPSQYQNPGSTPTAVQTGQAFGAAAQPQQEAATYDAATSYEQISEDGQAQAAQGTVSDNATVEAEQLDQQGTATGQNKDGSKNYTGEAVNAYAQQSISTVLDTTTAAGKMLAQELGEGNYTDLKSTVQGQMEILQKQFVDAGGNPTIPNWAAGTAREVSRIAAFKGMTGTAATAALGQAIMEASLPIAQADAQFFQTVSLQNLSNRQQQTINKANVLANLDLANLDARTTAAVQNAQAFLQMDMANLDNRQQAEMLNTQSRVQSILEDAKAQNAQRMFTAESENDFTKFYGQLNSQISMFNAEQRNAMEQFNTGEINDTAQFDAQLDMQREQFYKELQYNVDLSNARWRQTIATTNTQMLFDAYRQDAQILAGLTQETLNRVWDREDSILDYTWKATEGEQDRILARYSADKGVAYQHEKNAMGQDEAKGKALMTAGKAGWGAWQGAQMGAAAGPVGMVGGAIAGGLGSLFG